MQFNAFLLSRSWLSVAVAAADNDDRQVLYRTTLIEEFDYGVRLVSTDSYILLKAWVPFEGYDSEPEPPLDLPPERVAVCADRDKRILGLMKYVAAITRQHGEDTDITVSVSIVEGDHVAQATLEGLAASQIRMRVSSRYDEAIETPLFEGVFPNWRPLWHGHVWTNTAIVGLSAHTISKLGKLAGIWNKTNIEFLLGGKVGVAKIVLQGPDDDVNIEGLVMPIGLTSEVPQSAEVTVEAQIEAFSDALDDWLVQVTRMAEPEPEDEPGDADDDR